MVVTRLRNINVLSFITEGKTGGGFLWRWLQSRRSKRNS